MNLLARVERLNERWRSQHQLRACDAVGAGSQAKGSVLIVNRGQIVLGAGVQLSGEPVASHLLAEEGGVIEIGDRVSIGHGSGISARGRIRIGSGSRLGAFVLAMDTDYHVAGDSRAVAGVNPIEIGRDVFVGSRVTILRGSTLGDGARVLDGSVVRGDVPAGAVVEGVPARPARQAGTGDGTGSLELRVRRVAQATFRLRRLPELTHGPDQIESWDSLGALSFVLALEEEFSVLIGEDRMASIRTLSDAVAVVTNVSE